MRWCLACKGGVKGGVKGGGEGGVRRRLTRLAARDSSGWLRRFAQLYAVTHPLFPLLHYSPLHSSAPHATAACHSGAATSGLPGRGCTVTRQTNRSHTALSFTPSKRTCYCLEA